MSNKHYFLARSKCTGTRYICESDRPANGYREADSGGFATGASYGVCIYYNYESGWVKETDPQSPTFFSNTKWEVIPLITHEPCKVLPEGFTFA